MSFNDFQGVDPLSYLNVDFLGNVGNPPRRRTRVRGTRKITSIPRQKRSSALDIGSDFISYLNYEKSRKLNTTQDFGLNTNFFSYIGGGGTGRGRGGRRYPRNAFEVDYSQYINYGKRNAGGPEVPKRQAGNYLSYIPLGSQYDNPHSIEAKRADPLNGLIGFTQSATEAERTGIRGYHTAKREAEIIKQRRIDQQLLGSSGYGESRYERWKRKRDENKTYQQQQSQYSFIGPQPQGTPQYYGPMQPNIVQNRSRQPHTPLHPTSRNPMTPQPVSYSPYGFPNTSVRFRLPKGSVNQYRTPYRPKQQSPNVPSTQQPSSKAQSIMEGLVEQGVVVKRQKEKTETNHAEEGPNLNYYMSRNEEPEEKNTLGSYIKESQEPKKESGGGFFSSIKQKLTKKQKREQEMVQDYEKANDEGMLAEAIEEKVETAREKRNSNPRSKIEDEGPPSHSETELNRISRDAEIKRAREEMERQQKEREHQEEMNRKQSVHDQEKTGTDNVSAMYGFHGYVNHPTMFLAGEHGRERVVTHHVKRKHNDEGIYDFSGGIGKVNEKIFDFHGVDIGIGRKGKNHNVFDFSEMGGFRI